MISDLLPSSSAGPGMSFGQQLLMANWEADQGPIRLRRDLSLQDVGAAEFFVNTRHFLSALAEMNGPNATTTGSLNRNFVAQMFDQLLLPENYRDSVKAVCKVLNEHDLWPLHLLRVITQIAGLVRRRKRRFYLTRKGREMLADDEAGQLYCILFLTYFRNFDWRYEAPNFEPLLQLSGALVLWKLSIVTEDWIRVRGLAERVVVIPVLEQMEAARPPDSEMEDRLIVRFFLEPLLSFGLIQKGETDKSQDIIDDVIRIGPLWRKFISFVRLRHAVLPDDEGT